MPFALAFGDGLICGPDLMRPLATPRMQTPERRKRVRVGLTWTVFFSRLDENQPVQGETRNISSEGFYCLVARPFAVGEALGYTLLVPAFNGGQPRNLVRLEGQAAVLRIEPLGDTLFGVACAVQDYRVRPPDGVC